MAPRQAQEEAGGVGHAEAAQQAEAAGDADVAQRRVLHDRLGPLREHHDEVEEEPRTQLPQRQDSKVLLDIAVGVDVRREQRQEEVEGPEVEVGRIVIIIV